MKWVQEDREVEGENVGANEFDYDIDPSKIAFFSDVKDPGDRQIVDARAHSDFL